ncbi:hypothetical protein JCM10450v2_006658 [Rhodotorula kratochvilovae]
MPLSTAAALDAHLREATADPYNNVPRAVFLAARRDDPALYKGHAGWARLPASAVSAEELAAKGEPIQEDSVFELFSCTKLVGSIAALQLIEQGKVGMHDEVSIHVPEIRDVKVFKGVDADGELLLEEQERPVTVQMLFTHTAGFVYWAWRKDAPQVEKKLGLPLAPYGKDATRDSLYKIPLIHQPGAHFQYGTSIDWLTRIVEVVSGLDLATYVERNIFAPLGITDLSFDDNPAQVDMADATPDSPSSPYNCRRPTPYSATLRYGGSGLKGTAPSYLKLIRAILRGGALEDESSRILKPETVDTMFVPQLTAAQKADYHRDQFAGGEPFSRKAGKALADADWGLGGALSGTGLASERGARALHWSGMANTFWVIDRERDVAFVYFSNLLPYGNQRIFDLWEKLETDLYKGLDEAA